jgi:antitoxin ParD1/3/4
LVGRKLSSLIKEDQVASSEDLVRQLEEREERLAALDAAIARGRADVAAGRTKPADTVLERLDAKYRKMAKSRA